MFRGWKIKRRKKLEVKKKQDYELETLNVRIYGQQAALGAWAKVLRDEKLKIKDEEGKAGIAIKNALVTVGAIAIKV